MSEHAQLPVDVWRDTRVPNDPGAKKEQASVRDAAALELALDLDELLDAAPAVRLDGRLDPHERLDGRRDPVAHQLELAVGRDERDRAVGLEAREAHALVELDVLHLDRLPAGCCARMSVLPGTQRESETDCDRCSRT
jgi:hypothetical protein